MAIDTHGKLKVVCIGNQTEAVVRRMDSATFMVLLVRPTLVTYYTGCKSRSKHRAIYPIAKFQFRIGHRSETAMQHANALSRSTVELSLHAEVSKSNKNNGPVKRVTLLPLDGQAAILANGHLIV